MMRSEKLKKMVTMFQCPGCLYGDPLSEKQDAGKCKQFFATHFECGSACKSHTPSTFRDGINICQGMPENFNILNGAKYEVGTSYGNWPILFWDASEPPVYVDGASFPVIAGVHKMKDGVDYVFTRVFEPRIGRNRIDVIRGGKLSSIPGTKFVLAALADSE